METIFLTIMIFSLAAIFAVDTFQKRQSDLKSGKSK
jgi:hypothetical protein